MAQLVVTDMEGNTRTVEAETGISLMEIIRDNDFDDMAALCGGCCSCATCHIYVDEAWASKLGSVDDDEDELLSMAESRQENSRLSCQIEMTDELDGMPVTIAPGE
ncbi:MAG: 2Fe-2S iron-sulfur cluster-binding protein [Sphingomonadales bacterium]